MTQTLSPSAKIADRTDSLGVKGKTRRRKVLHLAGTDRGATWMAEQLRELKARGYDVKAYITGKGPLSEKLDSFAVPFEVTPLNVAWCVKDSWQFVRNIYVLAWRLFCERFDVVHSHLYPTTVLARFAAWIADVPVRIVMIPGPFYMEAESPPLLEALTAWMDTRVISSCEFTRTLYRNIGVPDKQLELIYYGPDSNSFDPSNVNRSDCRQRLLDEIGLPPDAHLIGLVAYFYPVLGESDFVPSYLWHKAIKNHETVIAAAPHVVSRCPDAHFVFVGDGWGEEGARHLESMKALVQVLGLEDHITFLGGRADVPELIAAFDVSLQCSLNENLGGTIESLLMERPIVGARVGGIVDSVRHEETGLLFDSTNHLELAQAITRLLKDKAFAATLATNGRQLMLEKFSLRTTADQLDSLYQRCLADCEEQSVFLRVGYRPWIVLWRMIACLWYIALSLTMFCRAEIRGRLHSVQQRASCHIANSTFALRYKLDAAGAFAGRSLGVLLEVIALELLERAAEDAKQITRAVRREAYVFVKRTLDIVMSLASMFILLPVLLLLLPIYIAFGLNPLRQHCVLGAFNERFDLLLFNGLPDAAPRWLCETVDRFKFLPATINILRGEMSFVGTRVRSAQLDISGSAEHEHDRWHMAPGLTGWCQLNRHDGDGDSALNAMDFLYIGHSGLALDARILLKTTKDLLVQPERRRAICQWVPD